MSIRGWLLLACAGFGTAYAAGELFRTPLLPSAQLLAWLALAVYLVVAARGAPMRVWLALGAGLLILGALAADSMRSTVDNDYGWFGYIALSEAPRESALDVAAEAVRDTLPILLAYACLALAAFLLPGRRTRAGIAVAVVGIGAAVAYTVAVLAPREGAASVYAALPALLVAVLALLIAARVPSRVVTAGLVLLAVAALALQGDVLDRVYITPAHSANAFLGPGLRFEARGIAASPLRPGFLGFTVAAVVQLAAAAAIVAGCLRRATGPARTEPDPAEA